MSAELEHYRHPAAPVIPITGGTPVAPLPPANDVDGWIQVVQQVAMLAERIADTDFVPDALRRKPAAVTAAILAGREMGVAPMTALQHINVIKGKPGQDALLMRALVLAAGHHIEFGDCNDTRALVRGKRRGEETWTEVVFTADQARKARIDLGGYPEDKLIARATSRLCRRKFADVISGLSYTLEELQDGDAEFITSEAPHELPAPAEEKPPRTAQRRQRAPKTPAASGGTAAPAAAAPTPQAGPPLPGEDGYDDEPQQPAEPAAAAEADTDRMSPAQQKKLFAILREADIDRDTRFRIASTVLGKDIDSYGQLTVADASVLIDLFELADRNGRLVEYLTAVAAGETPPALVDDPDSDAASPDATGA